MSQQDVSTQTAEEVDVPDSIDVKALLASILPHIKQRARLGEIDTDLDGVPVPNQMIQNLRAIHHVILHMTIRGDSKKEIAEATGYTSRMVDIIQESPAFKRQLERILAKAEGRTVSLAERVQSLKHEAMDVLEEQILRDPNGLSPAEQKLRVETAKEVIDRSGDIPNVKRHEALVAHLTAEDIEDLKLRATKKIAPGDPGWTDPALPELPAPAKKEEANG